MSFKALILGNTIQSVKAWNWFGFGTHLALFIAFVIWLTIALKPAFRDADVYRIAVAEPANPSDLQTSINFPIKLQGIGSINVPALLYSFFGVTFFFHLLYATDFFGAGYYSKAILQGWNPFRWLEYGISATIMILILALLSGCRDINSFLPIMVACAVTQGFGFLIEKNIIQYGYAKSVFETMSIQKGTEALETFVGSTLKSARTTVLAATGIAWPLLLIGVWVPILYTISMVIQDANGYDKSVPTWVPVIVALQLFYYTCFGFVQSWQVDRVRKFLDLPRYFTVEKLYLLLSLTAKATLGGVLAYGLLLRQSDAP